MLSLGTRLLARFLLLPVVLALLLLVPAGTPDYWQAYAYLLALAVPAVVAVGHFLANDPAVLERRLRSRETELTQKAVIAVIALLLVAGYLVCGLDRRGGWSNVPLAAVLAADLVVFLGYSLVFLVLQFNRHASRIVEVEAGQQVVRTGPYAIVRHPMYSGALLTFIATPVALGSWWGLSLFVFVPLLLVPRILNEEQVLRQRLEGYRQYCNEVRWRLLPLVW